MSEYRRWYVAGGTFFFTVVTYNRRRILTAPEGRRSLRNAMLKIKRRRPFQQLAISLLPDHLHAIWILPPGDGDYAIRWKRIKEEFTRYWLNVTQGSECQVTASQQVRGERGIWQPRFWEHTILDATDLEAHFDYIHWNPVKHRLVNRLADWPWTTFHKYVRMGHYAPEWGSREPKTYDHIESFGEPE
jgi:putative transposase